MDFCYRFPAVRGIQAGREYFITMIPLRLLSKLFGDDEEYVPPEYRAQRRLNTARIPVIRDYILDNRFSYVFSALAACVDGVCRFCPLDPSSGLGTLEVSMAARFMIVAGQHRNAAILEALREDETLSGETISIVLYADQGLEHSQQMFTDLNKHAVKTSNSIAELYDSRDALAVITRRVVSGIAFLDQYTDKEKDILGKFSSKFFTLNTFYKANKKCIRHSPCTDAVETFLKSYWSAVTGHIVPWSELAAKRLGKVELREQYIITQAIVIQAFGLLGHFFFTHADADPGQSLGGLEQIDWSRSAACWQGRVIRPNGKIINSSSAAHLVCNVIKQAVGIPLDSEDLGYEEKFYREK